MADGEAAQALPKTALRRLHRDLRALQTCPNPMIEVRPLPSDMLKWHFVLHDLPADTPYSGGCFHGMLWFPPSYPMAPPSIMMMTPSGRFEVNKQLCLSMTNFHPESWNPAWSTETILVGFLSFFTSEGAGYGGIKGSREEREQCAQASWDFNAADAVFAEIFPEFLAPPAAVSSSSDGTGAEAAAPPPPGTEIEIEMAALGAEAAAAAQAAGAADRGAVEVPAVQREGPAGAVAPAVAGGDDEEDNEAPECWICRDDASTEPLIQPCSCRGSMSYVHASCVELWISRHRRNAINGAAPRCSVCLQEYRGEEVRPGVGNLARQGLTHLVCKPVDCHTFIHAIVRAVLVILVLKFYFVAATCELPSGQRTLFLTMFCFFVVQKTIILMVSSQAAAPTSRCVALFYEKDEHMINFHIGEWAAMLCMLLIWWIVGTLSWGYVCPMVVGTFAIAVSRLLTLECSTSCWNDYCKSTVLILLFVSVLPASVLGSVFHFIAENPGKTVHPLGPGWHFIAVSASLPLMMLPQSNEPLLTVWAFHAVLILLAMLEQQFIGYFKWIRGTEWSLVFLLALCVSLYTMCLPTFQKGLGVNRTDRELLVTTASLLWVLLIGALGLSVHWKSFRHRYRTWQNRNGRFTLAGAAAGGAAAVV